MKREIGISSFCCGTMLSCADHVKAMAENGFTTTFCMSDSLYLEELFSCLSGTGIRCVNFHAPFRTCTAIWQEGEEGEQTEKNYMQAIENAVRFQVPQIVIHPAGNTHVWRVTDLGYERFSRIMSRAKKEGIHIAFENIRVLSNLAFLMEEFPEAGFCWDCGHEACFSGNRRFMPLYGDRLEAIHFHDNFGVQDEDVHMIPGDATLDFDRIVRSLASSPYTGPMMLEVMIRKGGTLYEQMEPAEFYRRAAAAARRLVDAEEAIKAE